MQHLHEIILRGSCWIESV